MRKIWTLFLCALFILPVHAHAVEAQEIEASRSFIQTLGNDAIKIMQNDSLAMSDRQVQFDSLLMRDFEMATIGRFALGRNWKGASKAQQATYQDLFETMILQVYSRRFEDYSGQILRVTGSQAQGKRDIQVNSLIVEPRGNGPQIRVDWRVRNRGKADNPDFKVIDIAVEGVSMSLTQRSDFASIIQRNGGDVQGLIDHLKDAVAK